MRAALITAFAFVLTAPWARAQAAAVAVGPQPMTELDRQRIIAEQTASFPLKFDEPVKDLGRIPDEAPIQLKFAFKNVADKPVTITGTSASCGCTVPQKLAKTLYAPGETGEVAVTFSPLGRRGKEVKHVFVDTDHPTTRRVDLVFDVDTMARVMIDPPNLLMGDVPKGEGRTQLVTVTGRAPGFDVTAARIGDNSTNFSIKRLDRTEIVEPETGAQLGRVTYQIELASTLPSSVYRATLLFTTNDTKRPSVSTLLQASVVGGVRVTPDQVILVENKAGAPWVRELRIDHRKGLPFQVTGVETKDVPKDLGAVYDLQPAQDLHTARSGYVLRLVGITPAATSTLLGKLVLKTTDPDQPTIEIPVRAYIHLITQQ